MLHIIFHILIYSESYEVYDFYDFLWIYCLANQLSHPFLVGEFWSPQPPRSSGLEPSFGESLRLSGLGEFEDH